MKTLFDYDITLEEAEELIKNGADVNMKNQYHVTPLHRQENIDIINLLIKHGADVNAKDIYGTTPLHYAQSMDVIQCLINNNANVNACSNAGITPIFNMRQANVLYLLKHGAEINFLDIDKIGILNEVNSESWNQFYIQNGAVASTIAIYQKCRNFFTPEQQEAFDLFMTITNNDEDFFNMCLSYQNDKKNQVKMKIKDMDIQ
jgi:ankyrin repeat protein